jgi:DNA replication protein DnaC
MPGPPRAVPGSTTRTFHPRRPGRWTGPRNRAPPRTRSYLALGDGARLADRGRRRGSTRLRVKMAAAVELAKLVGAGEVDWALGHAAVHARFAEADLASILASRPGHRAYLAGRGGPKPHPGHRRRGAAERPEPARPAGPRPARRGRPVSAPSITAGTGTRGSTGPGAGVSVAGVPMAPPLPADLEALLRRLRLPQIRRHAPDVIATAKSQRWDPIEVLRALLTEEATSRDRSALATRRAAATFPTGKTFGAWTPALSSIPIPTQQALPTLEWVGRRENLVVCGPSGTGKTFLLEALGQHAVETGRKVAWFTLENLGVLLRRHRADDTVSKAIARVLRADLVVVDDIGLLPVAADAAEGLDRLVDAAYEKRSVAVSSNLHPAAFDELMPKTLAAVLLGWPREMLVSGSLLCVPRSSQRSGRAVL